MKNRLACVLMLFSMSSTAFASFNTSDYMSARQIKTGNSNASTSVEAAYYNPAGLPWGMEEGFTLEFSTMPSYRKDDITVEYAPTAFGTAVNLRSDYEVVKSTPFYPALNMVYKKNNWAGFVNIGLAKGGGTGRVDHGLPTFDRAARGVLIGAVYEAFAALGDPNALINGVTLLDTPGLVDIQSEGRGSLRSLGILVGGAYAFNEKISFGGGLRFAYQKTTSEFTVNTLNLSGNPMYDLMNNDIEVEYEENGNCFGIFLNMAVRPIEHLIIANSLKYHTELEMEADVKKAGGIYAPLLQESGFVPQDGETSLETYAPQWSLGISYQFTPKLRAEFDSNIFLLSMVDENDHADRYEDISKNLRIGFEYQYNEELNLGAGLSYGFGDGLKDEFQSDQDFSSPFICANSGTSYLLRENLELTVAGQFCTQIEDPDRENDGTVNPNDPTSIVNVPYKETYIKGNSISGGFGIMYRF